MAKLSVPKIHVVSQITNIKSCLTNAVRAGLQEKVELIFHEDFADQKISSTTDAITQLKDAEIIVGDPGLIPGVLLQQLPKLKWMQSTWDGVNATCSTLDSALPLPKCTVTRLKGNFGTLMAEYTLAVILGHERFMIPLYKFQKMKTWTKPNKPRLLSNLTIGVLGVGSIGTEICQKCSLLGMKTLGLVSQPREENHSYIKKYYLTNELGEMLRHCDYVCNTLPSTPATIGLLSGDILSNCAERSPIFINVGRGDVIKEVEILEALDKGWISKAILDVFETEPLPQDSLLWCHEKVTITPHCSAQTMAEVLAQECIENLKQFIDGKNLHNIVDLERGY